MSRLTAIICAVVMCVLVCFGWAVNYYYDKYQSEIKRGDIAEAITLNFATTMNVINEISKAAHEEKESLQQKGETRVVYIHQALKGDACANQLVRTSVADSLRELKDSLRTGTSGTNQR